MKAKKSHPRIDGVANTAQEIANEAGAAIAEGAHQLEETVKVVGEAAQELTAEVIQSAKDARAREIHLAKEMAAMAHHRRQEIADGANFKRFGQ